MSITIGLLIFPDITQLDMTGPHEVFTKIPGAKVMTIWKDLEPITAGGGLRILPDVTYDTCPPLDVICVPGGAGMNPLLNDEATLVFLRRVAPNATYVTSVCTGSLVLGAAGLLKGKHAACHWMSRDMLSAFGAIPDPARVVFDGNIVSGGGVTSGIDFALALVARMFGDDLAKSIQLGIEYNPKPPFDAGSPDGAGNAITSAVLEKATSRQAARQAMVDEAAAKLGL